MHEETTRPPEREAGGSPETDRAAAHLRQFVEAVTDGAAREIGREFIGPALLELALARDELSQDLDPPRSQIALRRIDLAMDHLLGGTTAGDLPQPPDRLLDRAFAEAVHLGKPWCATIYCPVCLHETFDGILGDGPIVGVVSIGQIRERDSLAAEDHLLDPGDHPDADRPPGTAGSWGEA